MQVSKEQMEIELLKAKVELLETKIAIWVERLGPSDPIVKSYDEKIKKLNESILTLMVLTQKAETQRAIID